MSRKSSVANATKKPAHIVAVTNAVRPVRRSTFHSSPITKTSAPAKWDRVSKTDCKPDAKTFTLYCAFQAASIAVTGNPHYDGQAVQEVEQLVKRTAPNVERYNDRMNYNNDPGVTFQDVQKLLKTVETNLEKRMPPQEK